MVRCAVAATAEWGVPGRVIVIAPTLRPQPANPGARQSARGRAFAPWPSRVWMATTLASYLRARHFTLQLVDGARPQAGQERYLTDADAFRELLASLRYLGQLGPGRPSVCARSLPWL
jgi:hypothetical protein